MRMQTSIVCLLQDAQGQNFSLRIWRVSIAPRADGPEEGQAHFMTGQTLYDKVWAQHVVKNYDDGDSLIYIDRHLVQEVSSPQAFAGLIAENRALRRPDAHVAVADHAVPTRFRTNPLPDGLAARQVSRLTENARRFAIPYIPMDDHRHGIVHVIGPDPGFTVPGATLVCGDSHTCTHGASGA